MPSPSRSRKNNVMMATTSSRIASVNPAATAVVERSSAPPTDERRSSRAERNSSAGMPVRVEPQSNAASRRSQQGSHPPSRSSGHSSARTHREVPVWQHWRCPSPESGSARIPSRLRSSRPPRRPIACSSRSTIGVKTIDSTSAPESRVATARPDKCRRPRTQSAAAAMNESARTLHAQHGTVGLANQFMRVAVAPPEHSLNRATPDDQEVGVVALHGRCNFLRQARPFEI